MLLLKCSLKKRYSFDTGSRITGSPAIYSYGHDCLIVACTQSGDVIALDQNLRKLWHVKLKCVMSLEQKFFFEGDSFSSILEMPAVDDINGDGFPEVVFGANNCVLHCLSHKGKLLWKYNSRAPIRTVPLVLNHKSKKEIVFANTQGRLIFLDSRGRLLRTFNANSGIESSPTLLEREQDVCIVFGSNSGRVYCVSTDGDEIWHHDTKSKVAAQPAVGHLEGDKRLFVVVGTSLGRLFVLTSHGSPAWSFACGPIIAKPCLFDINNDGKLEIIFGSCDQNVYALSSSGAKVWTFRTDGWVNSSPIAADINRDGSPEIIVGTSDGTLYTLNSEGRFLMNYIPGVSSFLQQAGHYTDAITSDIGECDTKQLGSLKFGSMIAGTASFDSRIVVNTTDGVVSEVIFS
ncbi:MAG: PQQ-binding-like beta-propeller repeat protein [Candidatus Woesearchaeota archaeon]